MSVNLNRHNASGAERFHLAKWLPAGANLVEQAADPIQHFVSPYRRPSKSSGEQKLNRSESAIRR
jgi:hypothetical protein